MPAAGHTGRLRSQGRARKFGNEEEVGVRRRGRRADVWSRADSETNVAIAERHGVPGEANAMQHKSSRNGEAAPCGGETIPMDSPDLSADDPDVNDNLGL
jgi:hypothetical protein